MRKPKFKRVGELMVDSTPYHRLDEFAKGHRFVGIITETNKAGYIAFGRLTLGPGEYRRATLEDVLPLLEDGESQVLAKAEAIKSPSNVVQKNKPEKTIEEWELRCSPGGIFYLESHVRNEAGTWDIKFTSRVLKIDFDAMTAETSNSIYRLGRMKE